MPRTRRLEEEIEGILQADANTLQAQTIRYAPVSGSRTISLGPTSDIPAGISAGEYALVIETEPTHPSIAASSLDLENRVRTLEATVTALEKEVEQLKQAVTQAEGDVVALRTVSREEAKQEILHLFQSGDALDQAEVSERLSLDLMLVVDLCEELVKEGLVKYANDRD